jgi:hypothetical protein
LSTSTTSTTGTVMCNNGPGCPNGMPSPGSPCPQVGVCCDFVMCSHQPTSGFTNFYVDCVDAGPDAATDGGVWQWM